MISLLTDFGTRDPWVAICRGVILTIAPDARLVDVTHQIAPFDVLEGALTLAAALPELPLGTHLAVVDPGVGTERMGIGVRTKRGDVLVGPDNGLLLPAAEALGGIAAAYELRDARFRRSAISRTFHGRDVFAPAAAYLAIGVPLEQFGPRVRPDDLVALEIPHVERLETMLRTAVLAVDEFGNVKLAGDRHDLEVVLGPVQPGDPLLLEWWVQNAPANRQQLSWGDTFGDVGPGEMLLYEDSLRSLSISINQGSAADALGIGPDAVVNLLRRR